MTDQKFVYVVARIGPTGLEVCGIYDTHAGAVAGMEPGESVGKMPLNVDCRDEKTFEMTVMYPNGKTRTQRVTDDTRLDS